MKTSTLYERALKVNAKYVSIETIRKNSNPEIVEICEKIRNRADKTTPTVKEFADKIIKNKLREIAGTLPDEGYSMGSYINVYCLRIWGHVDRTSAYASSCKYRAMHGDVTLRLTPEEYRNTSVIANLVTYIYPGQKSKVKKCYWYEGRGQKNTFRMVKTVGYVYAGYHASDKTRAKEGGERNILEAKREANKSKLFAKALRRQYVYADSLASGNCEAGTRAFILRLGLDSSKKYRGSYILNLAKQKSANSIQYVERMIWYFAK